MKKSHVALVLFFLFAGVSIVFANWQSDLLKGGISSNGEDITIAGDLNVAGTTTTAAWHDACEDITVSDDVTIGDDLSVTGSWITQPLTVIVDHNTSTALELVAADNGTTYVCSGITDADADDTANFKLPAAAAGLTFTFIDGDPDANNDLWITAATGDKINDGTAAKSYKCTGDAAKQSVTLRAIDSTRWMVVAETGTWANDNS